MDKKFLALVEEYNFWVALVVSEQSEEDAIKALRERVLLSTVLSGSNLEASLRYIEDHEQEPTVGGE